MNPKTPRSHELLKLCDELDILKVENSELKKALAFYADRKNWFEEMGIDSPSLLDSGASARRALGMKK